MFDGLYPRPLPSIEPKEIVLHIPPLHQGSRILLNSERPKSVRKLPQPVLVHLRYLFRVWSGVQIPGPQDRETLPDIADGWRCRHHEARYGDISRHITLDPNLHGSATSSGQSLDNDANVPLYPEALEDCGV